MPAYLSTSCRFGLRLHAQEKIAHEHLRKDLGVKDVEDCVYDVSHYVDWLVGARLVAG